MSTEKARDLVSVGHAALKTAHRFTEDDLRALKHSHEEVLLALLGNDPVLYQMSARGKYNLDRVTRSMQATLANLSQSPSVSSNEQKSHYELALAKSNNLFDTAAAVKELSARRNY